MRWPFLGHSPAPGPASCSQFADETFTTAKRGSFVDLTLGFSAQMDLRLGETYMLVPLQGLKVPRDTLSTKVRLLAVNRRKRDRHNWPRTLAAHRSG
jgi:hypothetical protein